MNVLLVVTSCWIAVADAPAAPAIAADGDSTRVIVRSALTDAEAAQLTVESKGSKTPAGGAIPVGENVGRRWLTLSLKASRPDEAETPLFGVYELRDGSLVFRPRFGLVRGSTYTARAFSGGGPAGRASATTEYVVPPADLTPVTSVVDVSPGAATLPANVLKFYLTFSGPMREGREVLERIHLLDGDDREIGAPWRDIELWNADATRLSLFIHPGRIKQGVNLREQLGPVLRPGEKYTLVVGTDLRDAAGRTLVKEFRYRFTTTAELHAKIDVAGWKLSVPKVGSREALTIVFDRPLDRFLAQRGLTLHDDTGQELLGQAQSSPDGRLCSWTPTDRWSAGGYELRIDPLLEDLCGNTPVRVFDRDLDAPQVDVLPPTLVRTFIVE